MSILIAIIIFSLIIIFHEFGHYTLAKKNGIRVEEFSIGLGPTLVGFTRGETKWSIKLLPFGGACLMTGEDGESDDEKAFSNKSVWARIAVVAAGPLFNFLLAFLMSLVLISCIGYDEPVIYQVSDGYPAQEAGLMAGDRIIKIGSQNIHVYREISNYLYLHPAQQGEEITIVYERDGERYTTTLTTVYSEESGGYLFGFLWDGSRTRGNPLKVLAYSVYEVKYWICTTVSSLGLIFTGNVTASDVSGPVGIVSTISDTYEQSIAVSVFAAFVNMLYIAILLSANLGVMNLLPIPALDGGRLLFLILEVIRGRRVDPEKEGFVHLIGMACLLALMVLIMIKDIGQLL